ncbi:hypothetical protein [Amycolatopsis sp. CA-230715]|uniref:hypothetical protein n=1 Tax=Amycolatopsis sp. CA-230715 TaxID=2745196 RepID=UPI001C020E9A|nr:hypothetical protein [Amycolatopsis sp. CA-230715]QWF78935.1 hypothetical protein HUW46_02334 [Amycolatopsis sp. CA-230715]
MNGPSLSRTGRVLTALVLSCLVAGLAPAAANAASPAPVPSTTVAKGKVKVDAKLAKGKVKKGEKVKLTGKLAVQDRLDTDEPLIVQQQVSGGAWVNIANTTCRPNGGFSLNLSFSISASLSLRVYHPETTIYASAYSSVFALLVL